IISTHDEFDHLMRGLRGRDREAAPQVIERYGKCLRRFIRRRLNPLLQSQYDADDFIQEVWAAFFTRTEYDFNREEELIVFLAQMAHHKLVDAERLHLYTRKRDLQRERPLESLSLAEVEQLSDPGTGPTAVAELK